MCTFHLSTQWNNLGAVLSTASQAPLILGKEESLGMDPRPGETFKRLPGSVEEPPLLLVFLEVPQCLKSHRILISVLFVVWFPH